MFLTILMTAHPPWVALRGLFLTDFENTSVAGDISLAFDNAPVVDMTPAVVP